MRQFSVLYLYFDIRKKKIAIGKYTQSCNNVLTDLDDGDSFPKKDLTFFF